MNVSLYWAFLSSSHILVKVLDVITLEITKQRKERGDLERTRRKGGWGERIKEGEGWGGLVFKYVISIRAETYCSYTSPTSGHMSKILSTFWLVAYGEGYSSNDIKHQCIVITEMLSNHQAIIQFLVNSVLQI